MFKRLFGIGAPRAPRTGFRKGWALWLEPLEARELPTSTPLLIGTWNVDIADTGGANRNTTNFRTVFAAIGQESTYAPARPLDVLTVTEVRSNAVSGSNNDTDWLTQQLNAVYGAGVYAHDTLDGASTGGGTEGVIYNTQTVQLLQSRAVGTTSTSGTARQELRYLFRPAAAPDGSADFYVYVGHAKAGTASSDQTRRNVEAQQVRADADALGAGAHILYTGDFNSDSSNQAAEQTLLASGNGQAFDPINRLGSWGHSASFVDTDSIASTSLNSRFDLLWETGSVRSGVGGTGLKDGPATYHVFGNNGSVALNGSVSSSSNTALPGLPNRTTVLTDLTLCSDHLPVLQTYQVVTPSAPATHLQLTPSANPIVAGTPFGITVTALDANNNPVPSYTGSVQFMASTGSTANYTFTAADMGQHVFGGLVLTRARTITVTGTDAAQSSVTGSTTFTIIAAPAVALQLLAPSGVTAGTPFSVTVVAVDAYGNTDPNYAGTISFSSSDADPGVVLPPTYTFQAGDAGTSVFGGAVTLITPGVTTLTVTDLGSGINGSATVLVAAMG